MKKYLDAVSKTPQTEPLDERQVKNRAGGYVFALDKWARLNRFLILGSDAPTYYQSAGELSRENARVVSECWDEDSATTRQAIVDISVDGRAPKNDAAIFALALGTLSKDHKTRTRAFAAVNPVCRTSTHLFQFVRARKALGGGWGRGMKGAVADWYNRRDVDAVAYQAIKYRSREGFDHKRLLQLSHPNPEGNRDRDLLYRWMVGRGLDESCAPAIVRAHVACMGDITRAELLRLIKRHRLPWEAVPTAAKRDPKVWGAMLPHMGLTALIRSLGAMTACGALVPLGKNCDVVAERLTDAAGIRNARVHPFHILQALAVYRNGEGVRHSFHHVPLKWEPVEAVVAALNGAFYRAFEMIESTGRRTLLGLDVSGSMAHSMSGSVLSVREASAAMAMATMRTEPKHFVLGFSCKGLGAGGWPEGNVLKPLRINAGMDLPSVLREVKKMPFGRTDCALPMLYALDKGIDVDTFVIYTDNETYAGDIHPAQALARYRERSKIDAKLIVVGMTSNGFSIADPNDAGMLDVVGFDAACPALISTFSKGL